MAHPFGTHPDPRDEHSGVLTIVVSKATIARLWMHAAEMGRGDDYLWQPASDAVDEAALNAFSGRADDPARAVGSDQ